VSAESYLARRACLTDDANSPVPKDLSESDGGFESIRAVVELTGDLPCVRCRYNLRGLSIRGRCPECGTPVRVTLLAVVDPLASELRPILRPRLTSWGLLTWSLSGLAAACIIAVWRVVDVLLAGSIAPARERLLGVVIAGLVLLSGVGAVALVRPHAGLSAGAERWARLGVALYLPFAAVLLWIHAGIDPEIGSPYGGAEVVSVPRIVGRMVAAGLLGVILVALRPNGRALAARSMLMRTGQVDRQTMRALASALVLPFLGDLAELGSVVFRGRWADGLHTSGSFLILIGSALFVLGLVGVLIDCVRLVPVVSAPPLSIERLTGGRGS